MVNKLRGNNNNNTASVCQFSGEQHKRVHAERSPGFLERLSASTGGVIAGVCLFALSLYVLFTNEVRPDRSINLSISHASLTHLCLQGRALRTATSLDEGLNQVVSLHPDATLDAQNDGRLVHLTAPLRTAQVVTSRDATFTYTR